MTSSSSTIKVEEDEESISTEQPVLLEYSAVGFLVLDTLCRLPRPPPTSSADSCGDGKQEQQQALLLLPPAGGATTVSRIRMTPAGTAGGTAAVCGLLGLRGQLVSRVGDDDAGRWLVRKLRDDYNVSTRYVQVQQRQHQQQGRNDGDSDNTDVQTSCSVLPIRSTGERSAYFCPGTASTFTLDEYLSDIDDDDDGGGGEVGGSQLLDRTVLNAKILHLGGTGLLPGIDGLPSLKLMRRAKQLGRTTVFDLILADKGTFVLVEPLLPYIDYFCPSIEEAAVLAGYDGGDRRRDAPAIASFFKERGVKNVVLTCDVDGVYVLPDGAEPISIPAHDVSVVDTTGCGDSFTAGVIFGLARGYDDLRKTCAFANAVAAQVALGLGSDGDGQLSSNVEDTMRFMEATPYRPSSIIVGSLIV